jgi:hypothetical protein
MLSRDRRADRAGVQHVLGFRTQQEYIRFPHQR